MDQVVLAVFGPRPGKVCRRHLNDPFFVIRISSTKPPRINLPRHAPICPVLFEVIHLGGIPHRVDLLVTVVHETSDIHCAIWKPVPGKRTNGGKIARWFIRVIIGVVFQKLSRRVAELRVAIEPVLHLMLSDVWTKSRTISYSVI